MTPLIKRVNQKVIKMKVRVISGKYGGRVIEGSVTSRTHPMSERIRNSLFNILGDEVKNASVLDAFAGSGAVGFEALSRGAASVVMVEKDKVASRIISENGTVLKVGDEVKIVRAGVSQWQKTYQGDLFDLIFADPPYHDPQFSTAIKLLDLLKPNGLMVLSYPGRGEAPTANGVVVVDNRSYGTAALVFYRKKRDV